MRKKDDSMRGMLLRLAQEIADTEGIEAINIRSIAKKAGIATGTLYNYFSNKDELLLALTEEHWREALLEMGTEITADTFCGQLRQIFSFMKARIDRSAGKLMASLGNVGLTGQDRMASMQSALEAALVQRMEQDAGIRADAWNDSFTREQFARFLVVNLTLLLKVRADNIDFLITVVERTIY